MREHTNAAEILKRMRSMPARSIFTVDDFIDLADEETIRAELHRLTRDNTITRCINGYFTIPIKMTLIDGYGYPSTRDVAEKVAQRHGWKILPTKETVLNGLGLSTQVPAQTEYISTGPYREIEYRGNLIRFKHTNKLSLLQLPYNNALVIQAIKEIGKNRMTPKQFQRLCIYCKENVKEDLLCENIRIPSWIRRILRKIEEENYGKTTTNKQFRTSPSIS